MLSCPKYYEAVYLIQVRPQFFLWVAASNCPASQNAILKLGDCTTGLVFRSDGGQIAFPPQTTAPGFVYDPTEIRIRF